MANPTYAQVANQIGYGIGVIEKLRRAAILQGTTQGAQCFVSLEQTYQTAIKSDFWADANAALQSVRATLSAALAPEVKARFLLAQLKALAKVAGIPGTSAAELLPLLRDWMHTNSHYLKSPTSATFASITSGTPHVGNGLFYRVTTDDLGYALWTGHFDSKVIECVQDEQGGAGVHKPVWEIRGSAKPVDNVNETTIVDTTVGSGKVTQVVGLSSDDTASYLTNPSFSVRTPTTDYTTLTALSGWTIVSGTIKGVAQSTVSASSYYRDSDSDTSPACIEITKTGGAIFQELRNVDFSKPYLFQIGVLRRNSGKGAVVLQLCAGTGGAGAVYASAAVELSTLSNDAWVPLRLPLTTTKPWPRYFAVDTIGLRIRRINAGTTGEARIDDVTGGPGTEHDGAFWWYVTTPASGTITKPKRKDQFTVADSVSASGSIDWRHFRDAFYKQDGNAHIQLPIHASSYDITEPTVT